MKKILIVDDSYFMRLALKKIFPKNQYTFIESAGGEEALKLFGSENPDLTLLDIVMPNMRGVEILKEIKKKDAEAKVVMITAVGRETVVAECEKMGIVDYIKKPFDEDNVRDIVNKCLG
jgi:DNA-binding NtrC family response regulator